MKLEKQLLKIQEDFLNYQKELNKKLKELEKSVNKLSTKDEEWEKVEQPENMEVDLSGKKLVACDIKFGSRQSIEVYRDKDKISIYKEVIVPNGEDDIDSEWVEIASFNL
jgi:NurA-like 5'-3' nuclease